MEFAVLAFPRSEADKRPKSTAELLWEIISPALLAASTTTTSSRPHFSHTGRPRKCSKADVL
ncbi:MAG: hypothetical protein MEQ84_10845 [Mesorhizobium sp.]|nr:hypothetical protein [Mesorhizobium sp.]